MSNEHKPPSGRSVGIHIARSRGIKISQAKFVGLDAGIEAEDVIGLEAEGNEFLDQAEQPQNEPTGTRDYWYKKPIGVIVLSVVAILIASATIWLIGQAWAMFHG